MRNFLLAAMAAVAVLGAGLGGAAGQSSNDDRNRWIRVENESPFKASQIFIIPSDRDCCWSRDLLEDQEIEAKGKKDGGEGQARYRNVNFDDGSGACQFNIHITNKGYQHWSWLLANFNVCGTRNRVITLRSKRPDLTKNRLVIKNDSPFWAYYIYMIPAGKPCCWSRDLLGYRIIPTQRSAEVSFHDGTDDHCKFDIRIISDKKGIDWFLKDVNVCKNNDRAVGEQEISRQAQKEPDITLKAAKVRLITVKNETLLTALSAHTIPTGKDCCWSRDLLGSEVIRGGRSLDVDFNEGSGECTVDILFTRGPSTRSDSSREWRFDKINVCTETELVIRPPPEIGR